MLNDNTMTIHNSLVRALLISASWVSEYTSSFESKQIRPKNTGCLHFFLGSFVVVVLVALTVAVLVSVIVDIGGFVIEACFVFVCLECVVGSGSQQPKKKPGVSHVSLSFAVFVGAW